MKGWTLGLILKVRVCGTQKWAKYSNIGLYKFWGCKIFTGPKKLQVEKEALTGRAAKAVYLSLHTGGVGALKYGLWKVNLKGDSSIAYNFCWRQRFSGSWRGKVSCQGSTSPQAGIFRRESYWDVNSGSLKIKDNMGCVGRGKSKSFLKKNDTTDHTFTSWKLKSVHLSGKFYSNLKSSHNHKIECKNRHEKQYCWVVNSLK